MTHSTRFNGIFTAIVTPFTASGAIDWSAFDALIERQLKAGVAGLVPVGTTGEAATLTTEEAEAVIARTVARAKGRAYILAGTGSNATSKSVEATRRATDLGADGVLVVTPYYNKPSQHGLVAHFAAVAEATPLDVMLYSVPGRTGVAIAPETAGRLAADHRNIVAIKEAGGDAARVSDLRRAAPGLAVHCGDDGLALAFFALGAVGLTSVFANFDPATLVSLHRAWASGDTEAALAIHELQRPAAEAMFLENSPAPVKFALAQKGLLKPHVRLPLAEVSEPSKQHLTRVLGEYVSLKSSAEATLSALEPAD
jgi:4-hydroxy-tetrahydrodipicolinate synthase